jgi:serine/threonine-protein kinase RsbW
MRLILRLPRDPVSVPVTRRTVDSALDAIGVAAECREEVGLALTEACSNVVRHAADAVDYTVTVTATTTACTIDVRDAGTAVGAGADFASPAIRSRRHDGADAALNEGGRGLSIVRSVMDAVHIAAGPGGVAIHMVKQLIFGRRGYAGRFAGS